MVKSGKKRNTYQIEVLLSEELKRLFLSYGNQLEVLEPKELREQLKIEITELAELYG
jgi:predicted DNA-binding transcriptional regulator YafY